MDWKQERIDEINKEISNQPNKYMKEIITENYIDEYNALKNSKAKNFDEFKKRKGGNMTDINFYFSVSLLLVLVILIITI